MKKVADIVAISGQMIGALLIACNCGYTRLGYVAFLIGGAATLFLLNGTNAPKSLTFIAWFFVIVNIIGVICYGN